MGTCLRVVLVALALLTASLAVPVIPWIPQLCDLPTKQEVQDAFSGVANALLNEAQHVVVTTMEMHFTCLATVALDKYSAASVVVNFTDADAPDVIQTAQIEMTCGRYFAWGARFQHYDTGLPSEPFEIETQYQCFSCEFLPPDLPNYDQVSNCYHCPPECTSMGGGFCTGYYGETCCPFFNNDTGACVDDCTTINPNFAPNEDFVCVCANSCEPGFSLNTADCECVDQEEGSSQDPEGSG